MKTKATLFGTAIVALIAVTTLIIIIQSCNKSENSSKGAPPISSSVKQTESATVPYQDAAVTGWFKRNSNTEGSNAFDQAASVHCTYNSNNRDLWLFGDTYYQLMDANGDGDMACLFSNNTRNTELFQPFGNWTASASTNLTYAGSPQIFTDYSPDYFWPASGIEIGSKIYVYLTEMNGSSFVGGKIGVLDETACCGVSYSITLPALNGINFDNGMFQVGTTVYVYGTYLVNGYGTTNVYVAKFSTSSPGTWSFWNGASLGWQSYCPTPASGNGVVVQANSNALNISYVNNKYVMVMTQFEYNCDGGDQIYCTVSTSPTSGFSNINSNVIYHIPDRRNDVNGVAHTPFFYTPIIHPEYTTNTAQTKEFLFTYCINFYDNKYKDCVPQCNNSKAIPDDYRPRGVRVPFAYVGL